MCQDYVSLSRYSKIWQSGRECLLKCAREFLSKSVYLQFCTASLFKLLPDLLRVANGWKEMNLTGLGTIGEGILRVGVFSRPLKPRFRRSLVFLEIN